MNVDYCEIITCDHCDNEIKTSTGVILMEYVIIKVYDDERYVCHSCLCEIFYKRRENLEE